MKKLLTLILVAILSVSCFACGGKNPDEQGGTPTPTGTKPTYEKGEVITVFVDCAPYPTEARLLDYKNAGINTYNLTEDANPLNSQGYLNTLELCAELGLDVYIRSYDNFGQQEYPFANNIGKMYFDNLQFDFKDYPAVKGIYWWDEPNFNQFDEIAVEQVAYHNEHFKDDYVFHINLFPSYGHPDTQLGVQASGNGTAYENYVNGYVEKVLKNVQGKKTLSLDHYPMRASATTSYVSSSWLSDLGLVATLAKEYGAIFNSCIQTYGNGSQMRELQSVADFGFQIYANMALGASSFELYQYTDGHGATGLVSGSGELHPSYYYVKEILGYVHALEHVYLSFDWQGAMTVYGEEINNDTDCFFGVQKYVQESLPAIKSVRARTNTLVGHFTDAEKRNGYMISNFADPVVGKTDVVEIIYDGYTKATVYRNGKEEDVDLVEGKLKLILEKGEGAFVVPY